MKLKKASRAIWKPTSVGRGGPKIWGSNILEAVAINLIISVFIFSWEYLIKLVNPLALRASFGKQADLGKSDFRDRMLVQLSSMPGS